MTALDNLNKLGAVMDAARKKLQAEAQNAFRAACEEIFGTHPKLEAFSWAQYSPYFNDGDACEFGVHGLCGLVYDGVTFDGYELSVRESVYVKVGTKQVPSYGGRTREEDVYESQKLPAPILYSDGDEDVEIPDGFDMPGAIAAFRAIELVHSFLCANEEIAEAAFGNHVEVTVSRSGVETSEYSHD